MKVWATELKKASKNMGHPMEHTAQLLAIMSVLFNSPVRWGELSSLLQKQKPGLEEVTSIPKVTKLSLAESHLKLNTVLGIREQQMAVHTDAQWVPLGTC